MMSPEFTRRCRRLDVVQQAALSLDPRTLPEYALRTVLRMLAGLVASLVFTFMYATLAAKSRRAELVLIPILDVLQSVPILGYISFTVVLFLSLFPGKVLGAELAAVFAIFTSQAWNKVFSFYQSLRTVPRDLDEACRGFQVSARQRFWRLEVPFSMAGLVWNMMMSMGLRPEEVESGAALCDPRTLSGLPHPARVQRQTELPAVRSHNP